jgi:hypothetical protein
MRLLLALLALITGLSMPEVAFAASHAEVAESGGVAMAAAPTAAPQQVLVARRGAAQRDRSVVERRTVWLPTPAYGRNTSIALSDRPLE